MLVLVNPDNTISLRRSITEEEMIEINESYNEEDSDEVE